MTSNARTYNPSGDSGSTEYRTWYGIKQRCLNSKSAAFENYGGRGIRVCDRWLRSFADFLVDVGRKPSPRHSIDRRDNDGHYSCGKCDECIANGWPSNCRWATQKEQMGNTRSNPKLTLNGITKTIIEWAELRGLSTSTISSRMKKKWSVERALNTPKLPPDECIRDNMNAAEAAFMIAPESVSMSALIDLYRKWLHARGAWLEALGLSPFTAFNVSFQDLCTRRKLRNELVASLQEGASEDEVAERIDAYLSRA